MIIIIITGDRKHMGAIRREVREVFPSWHHPKQAAA